MRKIIQPELGTCFNNLQIHAKLKSMCTYG